MSRIRLAPASEPIDDWEVTHNPAANTKATIARRAPGVGKRNVVTGLTVCLCAGASAPSAIQVSVAVIDGTTGGTAYLWGPVVMSLPAVAGCMNGIAKSAMWREGSENVATTLEFSAAAGVNTVESVSLEGSTVTV